MLKTWPTFLLIFEIPDLINDKLQHASTDSVQNYETVGETSVILP